MRKIGDKRAQQVQSKSGRVSRDKLAQQEMVGFVLIVVVVIIALMVFLVISLRKPVQSVESSELENLLSSVMRYTTDCAINAEPDFDDVGALIKSCYNNRRCANLEIMACESMKDTLDKVLVEIYKSESKYQGYTFNITVVDKGSGEFEPLYGLSEGSCFGSSKTGSNKISIDSQTSIDVLLKLCD